MKSCPTEQFDCWVDGKRLRGEGLYPLIDPSTGKEFARVSLAGSETVDSALESAQAAFEIWRRTPAADRARMMRSFAEAVRRDAEFLSDLVCREVGKPLRTSRDEVMSAASLMDFFAEEATRLSGKVPLLGHDREHVLVVREPVGVAVAITPFNYPLSTLVCKMGAALAAGCTLVAKPDEHTPLSSLRMAELACTAGIPPGVFNVVTGYGKETGRMLVNHPTPRLISFTGSTFVGKEIQQVSAQWVRKTILELGGHCPAIVCEDAPWESIVPQLLSQSFKNCGQYCYRISRAYVAESIFHPFLDALEENISRLRVGPASDPFVDLGPLNNAEVLAGVSRQVNRAVEQGAKVHTGGRPLKIFQDGFYYAPTLLSHVHAGMSVSHEEVFGPVLIVSPFSTLPEAIRAANGTPFGLAAYVFSGNVGTALECAGELEMGSVWINRIHQAYPEAPFGGVKESGLGREKSSYGVEEYTELKSIYVSY